MSKIKGTEGKLWRALEMEKERQGRCAEDYENREW
jgi:hypothetical protein